MTVSINNITVIDGTGADPYTGSLLIREDKIIDIRKGKSAIIPADTVIGGEGFVCTPGFIDIHRHADYALFCEDFGNFALNQGLTTVINGNCGMSGAPIKLGSDVAHYQESVIGKAGSGIKTDSMQAYRESVKTFQPAVNTGILAGLGTIAANLNGMHEPLHKEMIPAIRHDLEKAIREGAVGISLGLGYKPLYFYPKEDIISCLEPFRNSNIPVTVHMRQEGDGMTEALKESVSIAKELRIPMGISHLKSIGKQNWHKVMPEALTILHNAINDGVRIGWDIYPYTAGSTQLMHVLPPEYCGSETKILNDPALYKRVGERIAEGTDFENAIRLCGYENIFPGRLYDASLREYNGLSLRDGALKAGMEPLRWLLTILSTEKSPSMIDFITCEEDIDLALKEKETAVISDSIYPADGGFHPRVAGTCSRLIERFVVQRNVLSLQEAVRKMTYLPAKRMHLEGRGMLKNNYRADICVFDPKKIREKSDYGKQLQPSEGMEYVLVNGRVALDRGKTAFLHAGDCI